MKRICTESLNRISSTTIDAALIYRWTMTALYQEQQIHRKMERRSHSHR